MDIEEMKRRLRQYSKEDILFNEPHVTERLLARGGDRRLIVTNLLDPSHLVRVVLQMGKYGDAVHKLYFDFDKTRTLVVPPHLRSARQEKFIYPHLHPEIQKLEMDAPMKKEFAYDHENDILLINKGFASDERFDGNIEVDGLILDMSTKGRIRGVEILCASAYLEKYDIVDLDSITDGDFTAVVEKGIIKIELVFRRGTKEDHARINTPLDMAAC